MKSKFVVMKNMFFQEALSLTLVFVVPIHKYQGLSLDCGISDQVFSPGMACVALSHVKQFENIHLIAFKSESVMISTKCLHEINCLRPLICHSTLYHLLNKNWRHVSSH